MNRVLIFFSVLLLFLDRLSKQFILVNPEKLVKNSDFYYFSINQYLLITIIGAVIILLLLLFLKNRNAGLLFIVLGGTSNLFDRIYFGYVIDWIRIWISVFNIADIMIFIGLLCLISHFHKSK